MTRVALLWHMHQPFYQDLATGEHIMPWVRLHALKDYWGMVALLREFPSVKATFNLVPSMLVQLEAFARDQAHDRHLEAGLTRADALTEDDRAFCVREFFHAHRPRMIDPYPRYAELLERRELAGDPRAQARQFSTDDLRDLQVWHKLAWVDPYYFDRDERVRRLVAKGRGFTEEDKATLREVELEVLRRVVPEYREAAARGQIEISTSPFYHPILPLLCDTDVYLRTHPGSRMPRERFQHPEDARAQLAKAVALHEELFGRRPQGLWPSEGSVSDAMVPLAASLGFRWMATDEAILARSVNLEFGRDARGYLDRPERLYKPYRVGRGEEAIACGFRDHALSDLIGFVYASWSPADAADDFVRRLAESGERYAARTGGREATIFVILDGENAWEHFEGQGRPFLRALYGRLAAHPELRTVSMSEACAAPADDLPSIFPGSWINGDFYIWIGHADDHRAWGQLADARRAIDQADQAPADALAQAREELYIAEGSDWFWWYGDDHSSEHDSTFDELFRRHVANIYRALDVPVPDELYVTNITTQAPSTAVHPPTGLITPTVDGEITSYFEWIGAGGVDLVSTGDAMHRVSDQTPVLSRIEFGCDAEHLYVLLAGPEPLAEVLREGFEVHLNFLKPSGVRVTVRREASAVTARLVDRATGDRLPADVTAGVTAAAGHVLEIRVPFSGLGLQVGSSVSFLVSLTAGGQEVEHHPRQRPIEVEAPGPQFSARNWTA